MQPDDTLRVLETHWQTPEMPKGMAERIIIHARSQPQQQPLLKQWASRLNHAFSEWNYALAYKGTVFAMIALLGVFTAEQGGMDDDDSLAQAHQSWTEEL